VRQPVVPRDTLGTGLLLLLVVPLRPVVILPTNKRWESQELDPRSEEAGRLLRRWGRLHAIFAACLVAQRSWCSSLLLQ